MGEKPHKKLEAWRKAVDLVVAIYDTTRRFPSDERFGLAGQMQRAAISVPSNIAEGAARGSNRGFVNALHIARGSLSELDTQLIIAQRLGYIGEEELARLALSLSEVDRLLNGLIASVRRKVAAALTCIALLLGMVGWLL
ncbi:MAG TPA: four helix bundle protein [Candidatus Methylomirabilis sp.]|jgi:four helix bundle protein